MTPEDFLKKKWKPYQEIDFKSSRIQNIDGQLGAIIPCMLLAVDFDEQLLKIIPFPGGYYEEKEFWARCEHCEISRPKLKVVGKK